MGDCSRTHYIIFLTRQYFKYSIQLFIAIAIWFPAKEKWNIFNLNFLFSFLFSFVVDSIVDVFLHKNFFSIAFSRQRSIVDTTVQRANIATLF